MKRRGVFVALAAWILLSCLPLRARAQSVHWDPPGGQLGFNQVSELSLVFEDCEPDGEPRLPQVDGLEFGRPSQSSQTSIVNFKVSRTFSYVYPVRPGKRSDISIPTFTVQTDKGTLRVAAATYSVGNAPVGNSGLSVDDISSATLTTNKDTYWAGEVFPIVYNLSVVRRYFHSLASNIEWQPAPLVAEDWTKPDPSETLVRGERRVISTQSTRAYAKQPGTFSIKPAGQMINLMVGQTGFGIFSQATVEQRQLNTNPLDLTIKPLPPAPADFSKAVGEFTFTSKVVPTSAAVGEPVTWTLELGGTGNWPDIGGLPQREVSNDFQVVQPKSKRAMKDGSLFDGTLSEDVVLVPTKPGTYRLASVHFTYFDTKAGAYKTVATDPVTITVGGAAPAATAPANTSGPVQFSLNPPAATAPAPNLPTAVAPAPPENLPRDPLPESARGPAPLPMRLLVLVAISAAVASVLVAWLVLAGLRSRQNDPQRRRREARAKLAATLAAIRDHGTKPEVRQALLKDWQQQVAALWEIPHAAPGTPLVHGCVSRRSPGAAPAWARLWSETDRALHSREPQLPADWMVRAEGALQAVRVPGWPPSSLLAARNLLPFLAVLAVALAPVSGRAEAATDAYRRGDFAAAEASWSRAAATTPADWTARHNLGLALAQQDRWAEAAAYWTSAFLRDSRSPITRWDLALGLQRSGMAPPLLVDLSRGEGRFKLVRLATPAEWQGAIVVAALLLATALILLLLQGYKRIGSWARPFALTASLLAVLLAAAATLSLRDYGLLADPGAAMVWRASTLRSIPTDADTTQKSSPLSAGSIAVAEKTFLGWTKLRFEGGQAGWVRTEDLISLYR
ncbi:MAG TPA: BatD family protein [Lacunisphaera sp.]|nr:BatD family protein [Lacunisphaera sp.]